MLRLKSNTGPAQLDLHTAMTCWDRRMGEMYRKGTGDVDYCADRVEEMGQGTEASSSPGPVIGVNVQVSCQSYLGLGAHIRSLSVRRVDLSKMR
jgi:hypothetical protein